MYNIVYKNPDGCTVTVAKNLTKDEVNDKIKELRKTFSLIKNWSNRGKFIALNLRSSRVSLLK